MTPAADSAACPFRPCPTCQRLLVWQVWHHATRETPPYWEPLAAAASPLTGLAHVCQADHVRDYG